MLIIGPLTDDITPVVLCLCPILRMEDKIAFVNKEIRVSC